MSKQGTNEIIRLSQCGASLILLFSTEREVLPIASKKMGGALENTFLATECHLLALYIEKQSFRLRWEKGIGPGTLFLWCVCRAGSR